MGNAVKRGKGVEEQHSWLGSDYRHWLTEEWLTGLVLCVTAIKGLPCTVYNRTYDNGETFLLDCRTQCACQVRDFHSSVTFEFYRDPYWGDEYVARLHAVCLLFIKWNLVFPGGKAAGHWHLPPTLSGAEVKPRVELYFCSPSGPSWPVIGWSLPLPLFHIALVVHCHYCSIHGQVYLPFQPRTKTSSTPVWEA